MTAPYVHTATRTDPPTAPVRFTRPVRSVLYFAGDQETDVAGCEGFGSDAILLDLEEPRAPFPEDERRKARKIVGDFLRSRGPRTEKDPLLFVRVQSIRSGFTLRDLSAVFCAALSGVMLPKITGPADVVGLDALLTGLEEEHGLPVGSKLIYPILETAAALRDAYEVAMASPRVAYMGGALSRFGDIQQALGYHWTPSGTETLFLRSKVLVDARAAGVRYPISGMWAGNIDDHDRLRRFASELRQLGYYGMLLNSMSTSLIPIVHEVFTETVDGELPEHILQAAQLDQQDI